MLGNSAVVGLLDDRLHRVAVKVVQTFHDTLPSRNHSPYRKARDIIISGFLGAGKTTALGRLAWHLTAAGQKVGLITNDQGRNFVDTAILSSRGFSTEEIPGGCFCCRFNSLVDAAQRLSESTRPDVFIADPVGSCTDLAATVTDPLRRMYGDNFTVAPISVPSGKADADSSHPELGELMPSQPKGNTPAIPAWAIGGFFGTFLLVFFGCGSVCAAVLTGVQVGVFQVAIVWGLGIATSIYLTGALSGAHLNPAMTRALTDAARNRMTFPAAFAAEVIGTAVLVLVIFCVTDERNKAHPAILTPVTIGLTVTLLISLLGPLTMACFNPARDLAPRLFSSLAGWGSAPFQVNGHGWLTVYVLAPCAGALLGGGVHRLLFRNAYEWAGTLKSP